MSSRYTKIVATLGPAVDGPDAIRDLIRAGMNVARLNCSHGDWATRRRWIEWIRRASPDLGPVGILADLQGPKFRIASLPGDALTLKVGDVVRVGIDLSATLRPQNPELFAAFEVGDRLLLGDGQVQLRLREREGGSFLALAETGGTIKSNQGLTIAGKSFRGSALTDKDRADVREACASGVDFIALSYVRSVEDLRELRLLVDEQDPGIRICAKIETREAVDAIEEIIEASDLVMIARGDLGLQIDFEDVPLVQKRIIRKCHAASRPAITATQMLESMIGSPRPTRAETTDVANAILDGTDAVMLSGETAVGNYPVEAVRTMARIAEKTEASREAQLRWRQIAAWNPDHHTSTEAIAFSAASIADHLDVRAIVCGTSSGLTPRMVSRFRPRKPILAACWSGRVARQQAVVWGVQAMAIPPPGRPDGGFSAALRRFVEGGHLEESDRVVLVSAMPPGEPGRTNMVRVDRVGAIVRSECAERLTKE